MITAVLDTNVLASGFAGFLKRASTPGQILHTWREGRFALVISEHIQTELGRTLQLPYFRQRLTPEQITGALVLLRRQTTVTEITAEVHGVATHQEDDLTLATAVSARADYLVTGDKKLQGLGSYQGVAIVSPREFLEVLRSQATE